MTDLIEDIEHATTLFIRGHAKQAATIGKALLGRARGTPHAARVYRYVAEFLHAAGQYKPARETAIEAVSLARALRQPNEILASSLILLSCDMYEGRAFHTYRRIKELTERTPDQLISTVFLAQVMLVVGDFHSSIQILDRAISILDEQSSKGRQPSIDLFRSSIHTTQGKAYLLTHKPLEAIAILERSLDLEIPTPVPMTLAKAMLAVAMSQTGHSQQADHMMEQALEQARAISEDTYGHILTFSGLQNLHAGKLNEAATRLRESVTHLSHQLEQQESYCTLGDIYLRMEKKITAQKAYQKATKPCTESFFGRNALIALRKLVGLRLV